MDSVILHGLVEVQAKGPSTLNDTDDTIPIQEPLRTYQSSKQVNLTEPSSVERGTSFERDIPPADSSSKGADLEMRSLSRPAEPPSPEDAAEIQPSVWHPYMNRYRLVSMCIASLGNALFDGAAGALIPYMEEYYNIGFAVVSLIFVGQAIGFIMSAFLLDSLRALLGRAKLLALGQTLLIIACTPLIALAPFPVIVTCCLLIGFGIAINVAMGNIFCGGLQNGTLMLGCLHGFYGIGGTTGPLIATAMVTVGGVAWGRYYAVILGVFVVTLGLAVWSFWRFEDEQTPEARAKEMPADQRTALRAMFSALKLRVVTLGALFIFAYQGAEVSISGWVISFLIHARGGDPSSVGYVTSGFWAGITLGRFVLSHPAQKIGEKRFVYAMTVAAIGLQLLVWFVPNIVGNAVAVSIVGLVLGPIYPCTVSVIMKSLPGRDTLSGMGTISAFGSMGGAVAPFLTGLLAQAVGTWVLHPIVITLFVVMLICWYCIPKVDKKAD